MGDCRVVMFGEFIFIETVPDFPGNSAPEVEFRKAVAEPSAQRENDFGMSSLKRVPV
jgi:hypothetical protein